MAISRLSIAFYVVRALLVILLAIIFLISTIYFVKAIDAIGDDVEEARETHWGHEVEESGLEIEDNVKRHHPDEYDDNGFDNNDLERELYHRNHKNPKGRLITGHHHFTVTRSDHKHEHIISLIIWVVLTMFAAILSLAGIIGAFCLNPWMVVFSALMILVHAIFSHILPLFKISLPNMTSNWFLMALEAPAIVLAIIFVVLHRAKQRQTAAKNRQRRILY